MYEELEQLDDRLARLAHTLRGGDVVMACLQLAEIALKLDRAMHREERALEVLERTKPETLSPLRKVRREHGSLRRLISGIAASLDAGDQHRGLELIGRLRSVLLVHLAKEEVFHPLFVSV